MKEYTCQLCNDAFKRAGQLKAHLSNKHMDYKEQGGEGNIKKVETFNAFEFQHKGRLRGVQELVDAQKVLSSNGVTLITDKVVQDMVAAAEAEGQPQVTQVQMVTQVATQYLTKMKRSLLHTIIQLNLLLLSGFYLRIKMM